ncbi:hypothetical protein QCW_3093 [Clostridioides difficile CD69]|nr:hypothetical protein QCW_3093 [Clostridioides difficile CD69]
MFSNSFTVRMEVFVAFITSTSTRISYSLQSLNSSCASFSKTGFAIRIVSHSNSSADTFRRFAIATSVVRLTLEFPVSILLTCCGVTPILSATVSCVMFWFILCWGSKKSCYSFRKNTWLWFCYWFYVLNICTTFSRNLCV